MKAISSRLAHHRSLLIACAKILSALILTLTSVGGLIACTADRFILHDEPTVLAIAIAFHHGQSMYPTSNAPVEYGLLYGPITFLVCLPPIFLNSMRVGINQAWAVLALALTLLFLYLAARKILSTRQQAFAAITLFVILLAPLINSAWSIKGDVWILLFSAIGIWASLARTRWPATIIIAIAGASLVDLKFPLLLLALLPSVLLWQRDRTTRFPAILSALLILPLALIPFAIPGISLTGYIHQLRNAGHHGFSAATLLIDAPYFLYILIPTIALLWLALKTNPQATGNWARQCSPFLFLFAATFATATLTGIKHGGGPWHGMVLTVPLIFLNAELWNLTSPSASHKAPNAFALTLAFAAITLLLAPAALAHGIHRHLHERPPAAQASMPAVEREVVQIIHQHPNETLQMGYSDFDHYNLTYIRPIMQIAGVPLIFDPDARNEADLIGEPLSPAILHALDTCTIDLWLIPRGGTPFSMESLYSLDGTIPHQPLYPESFQHIFFTRYQRIPSNTQYFDLYACRTKPNI